MKILKVLISFLGGAAVGIGSAKAMLRQNEEKADKYKRLCHLYEGWLMLRQKGETLAGYFYKNAIRRIAIYGYGPIGEALLRELGQSEVRVEYIIDRKKTVKTDGISLYHPDDELPDVDAIIVTPLMEGRAIEKILRDKFNGTILLIEDILYECL